MPHFGILLFAAIALSPNSAHVPPRSSRTFTPSGGTAPYTFSFVSNASGAKLSGGLYTAGSVGDVNDVVRVKDALGDTGTVTIAVGPGVSIAPSTKKLPPHGSFVFAATGGSGSDFTWTVDGSGTIDHGGHYIASTGGATLHATDSLGNTASATVTIGPNVAIDPEEASVNTGGSLTFAATGGSGHYTFTLDPNESDGKIDPSSGIYVAGANGNVDDVVMVNDDVGNSVTATVHVRGSTVVGPTPSTVPTVPTVEPAKIDQPKQDQTGIPKSHVNLAGGGFADNACDCGIVGVPTNRRGGGALLLSVALGGLIVVRRAKRR